jgi:hypothetical protein
MNSLLWKLLKPTLKAKDSHFSSTGINQELMRDFIKSREPQNIAHQEEENI